MIPDIKTLMLLYVITNIINTGAIAFIWSQNRQRFAGVSFWLVMMALQVAGASLHILRGQVPDLISMTLANTLALAGVLILLIGLERFTGKKGRQIHNYILLAIFVTVSAYFVEIQPNLPARDIALSAMLMIYTFQCSWLLLRRVEPGMLKITRLAGTVLAFNALFNFARIILNISFPEQSNDFYKSGAVNALAITGYIVLNMCLAISLILMVSKRLVADVRAQEDKFSKTFHSAPYAIAITKLSDGTIFEVNDGFVNITGYQYDEIIGKTTLDLKLWFRTEDRIAVVNELNQGHDVRGVEYQFRHKTGAVITGLFSAILVNIDNETCIVASINDITGRKRTEDALRVAEETYRNIFLNSQIGLFRTDVQTGLILDANDTVARFIGYPDRASLLANPFSLAERYVDAHTRAEMLSLLQVHGEIHNYEARFRRNDGSIIWMRFSAKIVRDKGWIEGVSEDITERKQVEKALRDSELRYRSLIEYSSDAIFCVDEKGEYKFTNNLFATTFGKTPDYFIGKTFWDIYPKEHADYRYEATKRVFQTGKSESLEVEVPLPDKTLYFYATADPVKDETGKVILNLTHATDITDRKRVEAENAELEARNRQLQKSESLGRMAGAIAHHFNNQLGVVIGNLELAMAELPESAPHSKSLTSAMKSAWKAADMSSLMLTYLGQSYNKVEPLDISSSCHKILPILKATIPANVILETDFSSPGPVVNTNHDYMQQILSNLITNAWESVGNNQGNISLSVKTVSPTTIPTKNRFPIDWQTQNNAYACLEITDTGSGIEGQNIEKIFDPFYSTKFSGRGMGLAAVLGIVKTHNGVLAVESKPTQGSTFRVFFPVSEEPLRQPLKAENYGDIPMSAASLIKMEEGGTVLLVEDEEPLRKMASTMLKRLGFAVLEAKDGSEALDVFGQHQNEIKFVLSDLTMPRMDGWETLTALRKLAPGLPVILASGYNESQVMAGDHPNLPQAFLGKPYSSKALSDAICQVLGKKAAG